MVVHLEWGDDIVIVEGVTEAVHRPEPGLAARLIAAFDAKYGARYDYVYDAANWQDGGLYLVHPHKVLGWTGFHIQDATRWTLGDS